MITAVDTNLLLDLIVPNKAFFRTSLEHLSEAATAGAVVVCDVVYAELLVAFETRQDGDAFLGELDIRIEALRPSASFLASRSWQGYRDRGGKRERMLPDFLIGAHAQVQADQLLSRDRGFYASRFPDLKVVDPSR